MDQKVELVNIKDTENNRVSGAEGLPQNVSTGAVYFFFTDKYTKNRYFYTKYKIDHNGKQKYVAGIYKVLKEGALVLRETVGFAKKKKAMEWAKKISENYTAYYEKKKHENLLKGYVEGFPKLKEYIEYKKGLENVN